MNVSYTVSVDDKELFTISGLIVHSSSTGRRLFGRFLRGACSKDLLNAVPELIQALLSTIPSKAAELLAVMVAKEALKKSTDELICRGLDKSKPVSPDPGPLARSARPAAEVEAEAGGGTRTRPSLHQLVALCGWRRDRRMDRGRRPRRTIAGVMLPHGVDRPPVADGSVKAPRRE